MRQVERAYVILIVALFLVFILGIFAAEDTISKRDGLYCHMTRGSVDLNDCITIVPR